MAVSKIAVPFEAYKKLRAEQVAFTVMMVAFSAKGGYPEFSLSLNEIATH